MSIIITYGIIFVIILLLELAYFKVADKYNIIDKPNERSSHSTIVLRGGGIIFTLSTLIWVGLQGIHGDWHIVLGYCPFLLGLFLVAGVSFIDDIVSLPDNVRLVAQFTSYALMFWNLGVFDLFGEYGWMMGVGATLLALIVVVGATNIINFMDGVNGITAVYSLSVFVPLFILNNSMPEPFILNSLIGIVILSVLVFCLFNFRPRGKAKCFAGDAGSIGIAYIMLFMIGNLILVTKDLTYLIFLLVYGIDGCLTICHRILLHENLGEAHRKHAYQLMANELKIGHMKVSSFYALLQLVISLSFIYLCPNTEVAHWTYLAVAIIILTLAYILFMMKYYHLHKEYLASLKSNHNDAN